MKFIEAAIKRPVAVLSIVLMTVLLGWLALQTIPIQLTPDARKPLVIVDTRWRGAAPAEIEREIVNRQEDVLKGLEGLERNADQEAAMRAESLFGAGAYPDHLGRTPGRGGELRKVACHHRPGREHRVASSPDSGSDDRMRADPDIVTDRDPTAAIDQSSRIRGKPLCPRACSEASGRNPSAIFTPAQVGDRGGPAGIRFRFHSILESL